MANQHEVIIIGAGTTGAAAAYHLARAGIANCLCLDMGAVGQGRTAARRVAAGTPLMAGDESEYAPHNSGTAVFEGGANGPRTIKMIVTLPPYLTLDGFADQHGWDGVNTYLNLAMRGRDLQLQLAHQLLPNPSEQVKQCGSLMVCEPERVQRLRQEFDALQRLGCACDWWDRDQVVAAHGAASTFAAGIWFANDARIDSVSYARALLDAACASGAVSLREHCPAVVDVHSNGADQPVTVALADGSELKAARVIVATGGMYSDAHLAGLLVPRYSYLVALPHRDPGAGGGMAAPNSANFFTLGFSHDWCVADNFVRISGEDHYSGLKSPRASERCGRLAQWGWDNYPYLEAGVAHPQKYGLYSETADFMPLVGTPHDDSRVCYLVGCNAWGQASLSAAAALAPALLGYRPLSAEESATARLFSMRRFSAMRSERE